MNTEYKIIYPIVKPIIKKKEKLSTPDELINTLIQTARNEKIIGVLNKRKAQSIANSDFGKIDIWRIYPFNNIERTLFTVILDDGLKLSSEIINKMFMDGGLISIWGTYKGFPIPIKDYSKNEIIELTSMDEFERAFLSGSPVAYSWGDFEKLLKNNWRN